MNFDDYVLLLLVLCLLDFSFCRVYVGILFNCIFGVFSFVFFLCSEQDLTFGLFNSPLLFFFVLFWYQRRLNEIIFPCLGNRV